MLSKGHIFAILVIGISMISTSIIFAQETPIPERGTQSEFTLSLTSSSILPDIDSKQLLRDAKITFLGEINHESLEIAIKSSDQFSKIPFLSNDPNYDEMKKNIPLDESKIGLAKKAPQITSQIVKPKDLITLTGFEGITQNGFIPPDVQVATGTTYVVQMVNSEYRIFTKQGVFIEGNTLANFFQTGANVPGDPKIFYDTQSGRWFASALVKDLDSARIAISTTNDPTGTWIIYDIFYGNGICPDQPRIGTSNDKFVLSSNLFSFNCSFFSGAHFWIFDKSELFSGTIVNAQQFGPDFSRFSISPARSLSPTGDLYLVNVVPPSDSFVEIFTLSGAVPSVTLDGNLLPMLPSTSPPDAQQSGTSNLVDTGDMRIQDADWYLGKLWFSFNDSCIPIGDSVTRSCIHLVELDTSTPAITQDLRLGAVGFYYFYPAISIDQFGGLGAVFEYSSASTFPSVAVTGQPAGSPVGTLYNPIAIRVGTDFNPTTRAGDYLGAVTDPINPSIIWVSGEYHDSAAWSTWIESINVSDNDNDGVIDEIDNCLNLFNPEQEDSDFDGVGDACDVCPDGDDNVDTDGDGIPDACDLDVEGIIAFQGHGYFLDSLGIPQFDGACGILSSVCWQIGFDLTRDLSFSIRGQLNPITGELSTATYVMNNCSRGTFFNGGSNQESSRCFNERLPEFSRHSAFEYNGGMKLTKGVGHDHFLIPRIADDIFIPDLDETSVPGNVFDIISSPGMRELKGRFILDDIQVVPGP